MFFEAYWFMRADWILVQNSKVLRVSLKQFYPLATVPITKKLPLCKSFAKTTLERVVSDRTC
jgi:hypothetical protein